MKKFSVSLTMLAVLVLVATALAFMGCGGGSAVPKTIEGLYNEIKGFNPDYLYLMKNGVEGTVDWCSEHNAWEPWTEKDQLIHGGTPSFGVADAQVFKEAFGLTEMMPIPLPRGMQSRNSILFSEMDTSKMILQKLPGRVMAVNIRGIHSI